MVLIKDVESLLIPVSSRKGVFALFRVACAWGKLASVIITLLSDWATTSATVSCRCLLSSTPDRRIDRCLQCACERGRREWLLIGLVPIQMKGDDTTQLHVLNTKWGQHLSLSYLSARDNSLGNLGLLLRGWLAISTFNGPTRDFFRVQ